MTIENDFQGQAMPFMDEVPVITTEILPRKSSDGSQTLYRKWRSQTFDELVGQAAITRTLQNAIASGRTAHAYLFCGPRGTGKTSTGRLLAKAVNCLHADPMMRPCDKCEACRSIAEARALDLIEIDAASNRGIDEVRELRDKINFQPSFLKKKVYIIDEVHMMTEAAFNALLKTLEEPPPHAMFVLATTDPQDIPATVVSRCQRFDFQRISLEQIVGRLTYICEQEGVPAETTALDMVARQATGSLRDALSLLDQLIVYSGGAITTDAVRLMLGVMNIEAVADFVEALAASDMAAGLEQINRLVQAGTDLKRFNRELVEHLRNLMLLKANPNSRELSDMTNEAYQRLSEQSSRLALPTILTFLKVFSTVDYNLKVSPYGQLPLELALMECLAQPAAVAQTQTAPAPTQLRPTAPPQPLRPAPAPVQEDPVAMMAKPAPVRESAKENAGLEGKELKENGRSPVVVPEVVPDVVVTGGEIRLELAAILKIWPEAVRNIKAQSAMTAALLEETKPVNLRGNMVSLAFAYEFHRNRINQEATRRKVEQHISKLVGQPVVIECIDQAVSSGEGNTAAPSAAPAAPVDGYTRKVLDIFNAKPV